MTELKLNRRQIVRAAAGVAAGGALVGGAGAASATAADSGHGLIGSWWVTHTSDPPEPPEEGVTIVSFIAGGVTVANQLTPTPLVSTGTWEAREGNRFRASFWGGFPETPEGPAGYLRVDIRGRLEGDKVRGTFTVHVFDTSDTEVFSLTGTFVGTRL